MICDMALEKNGNKFLQLRKQIKLLCYQVTRGRYTKPHTVCMP